MTTTTNGVNTGATYRIRRSVPSLGSQYSRRGRARLGHRRDRQGYAFSAGVLAAVLHLITFPRLIKVIKITICQRIGCLLAIPSFAIVPHSKGRSWNDSTLFVMSVASTTLVYGSMTMGNAALTIASTTMVDSHMRGKIGGLFNMTANLGRTLGPVGSATLFAWSVSASSYDWVGHEFVFLGTALSIALVAILSWGTNTDENVMISA